MHLQVSQNSPCIWAHATVPKIPFKPNLGRQPPTLPQTHSSSIHVSPFKNPVASPHPERAPLAPTAHSVVHTQNLQTQMHPNMAHRAFEDTTPNKATTTTVANYPAHIGRQNALHSPHTHTHAHTHPRWATLSPHTGRTRPMLPSCERFLPPSSVCAPDGWPTETNQQMNGAIQKLHSADSTDLHRPANKHSLHCRPPAWRLPHQPALELRLT